MVRRWNPGGLPTRGTSFGAKLTASSSSTASIESNASKSVLLLRSSTAVVRVGLDRWKLLVVDIIKGFNVIQFCAKYMQLYFLFENKDTCKGETEKPKYSSTQMSFD